MTIERRDTVIPAEPVRLRDNGPGKPKTIVGYASVFYNSADPGGTGYMLWSKCQERIMPGAFDRAVMEDDVRALFNHDTNLILGRNLSGTCRLSVDSKGLRYEIDVPDTQTGRDVATSIQRGDVSGSSFGFIPVATMERQEGNLWVEELHEVKLLDVSPVVYPAYAATEAGTRSASPGGSGSRSSAVSTPARRMTRDEVETWLLMTRAGRHGDHEEAEKAHSLLRKLRSRRPGAQVVRRTGTLASDLAEVDQLSVALVLDEIDEPSAADRRNRQRPGADSSRPIEDHEAWVF